MRLQNLKLLSSLLLLLLFGCNTPQQIIGPDIAKMETTSISLPEINKLENVIADSTSTSTVQNICGNIPVPTTLGELNLDDIYSSTVSVAANASLSAYGFSGTMAKKDIMIAAVFVKYKDYTCGTTRKRAMVGIRVFVHATDLKIKASSPTLPTIAAAVELGLAKAEYRIKKFGIDLEGFYSNLPSAQFSVDTYGKVVGSYDAMVKSLSKSTVIDPIIIDTPQDGTGF